MSQRASESCESCESSCEPCETDVSSQSIFLSSAFGGFWLFGTSFRYPRSPFNIVLLSAFIFFNFCQGKFCFFLLSLIFEKVQLQFLKLLKSSAKFLVKKKSGRVPLQLIGKKKSKMNSLQVEMHALLQFSI